MIEGLYKPFQNWGKDGAAWVIADTHFGEDDLRAAYRRRPDPETFVKTINSKVGKKGTLILLGDVGDLEYAQRLKGYKILVCGNHDQGASMYEDVFDEVYAGPIIISPRLILSHEPVCFPYMYNVHGHNHNGPLCTYGHMNVCADVIGYSPIHFNTLVKSGKLKECENIHRITIDRATEKKKLKN